MSSQLSKFAIAIGILGLASLPTAQALQDNMGGQMSMGKVLSVTHNQIIIQSDPDQLSRTTTETTTAKTVNHNDSNLAPGTTEAKDPNGNYKDTTGNPHDTALGKEIRDTHNSTGISDGNSSEAKELKTYSRTSTTTHELDPRGAASDIEAFQVTANTKLNNLSSINDISANDYVEISYTKENGKNVATSITKSAGNASQNL